MNKDSFIKILKEITPQQINKIIEQKGKEPKSIRPFIIEDIKLKA